MEIQKTVLDDILHLTELLWNRCNLKPVKTHTQIYLYSIHMKMKFAIEYYISILPSQNDPSPRSSHLSYNLQLPYSFLEHEV